MNMGRLWLRILCFIPLLFLQFRILIKNTLKLKEIFVMSIRNFLRFF
nr:MAG TPA: hypothetical protein [Caudoviricetes sp.]